MPPTELQQTAKGFLSLMTRAEFRSAFATATRLIQQALAHLESRIDARLATVKDGAQGPRGLKGDRGETGPQGPQGVKGDKGDTGTVDETALAARVVEQASPAILSALELDIPALGEAIRDALELLQGTNRLSITAIEGIDKAIADHAAKTLGALGPGGGTSFSIQQSGVQKVQQPLTLNFKGAGAPTISLGSNGVTHLDFPSGNGFTALAATETPNGTLSVFTFATATAKPSYLVVDNVWMKATSKAGTPNWTWNAATLKATLQIPPSDDIWAVV